MSRCSE